MGLPRQIGWLAVIVIALWVALGLFILLYSRRIDR
jgi:hypothetical protein